MGFSKNIFVVFIILFSKNIYAQKIVKTIDELKNLNPSEFSALVYLDANENSGSFIYRTNKDNLEDNAIVINSEYNGQWLRVYDKSFGVNVSWFGAKCDGKSDDTFAIQKALDKGGLINFPAMKKTKISRSLIIKHNGTKINGNGIEIIYTGNSEALGSIPESNKVFPVHIVISDVNLILLNPNSSGIKWKFSYSTLNRVGITLKNNNQIGIELIGDEYGTGSYYNSFNDVFIQGSRHLGKKSNIGWKFVYHEKRSSRSPNANVWYGGRIGQCEVGMSINGAGNSVNNLTVEGCKTAFSLGYRLGNEKSSCYTNKIINCYIEIADLAFDFGPDCVLSEVSKSYMTGVKKEFNDLGKRNVIR